MNLYTMTIEKLIILKINNLELYVLMQEYISKLSIRSLITGK